MKGNIFDYLNQIFELDLPPGLTTLSAHIDYIVPKVQAWSQDLKEESHYTGKRWLEVRDDDFWNKSFVHIFMPGGEYVKSDNGVVSKSTWRYLGASNTLFLDEGKNLTLMYDLIFLNDQFIILKQNGTDRYFVLAEEGFLRKINFNWVDAMEELYNIYRSNSQFILWIMMIVGIFLLLAVYSVT